MTSRFDADDPEMIGRAAPADLGPLFGAAWPEVRPAPEVEQRVLPLDGTIEGRYQAWKATENGERVRAEFTRQALAELAAGATRIESKWLWACCRKALRVQMNNSFCALLLRDVLAAHPELRRCFELRERRAS